MIYQTEAEVSDSFRDFIKGGGYEKHILSILNKSTKVLAGRFFEHITDQPNGESDFVDDKGQRYDVKLLFDNELGQLLGDRKNNLVLWIKKMIAERAEYSESIKQRNLSLVSETRLYKVMSARMENIKDNENAILFIPFPIVNDFAGFIHVQTCTDFLQAVYNRLEEQGIIGTRKVFFIYPSMEKNTYVLRDAHGRRENIACMELSNYISYQTIIT